MTAAPERAELAGETDVAGFRRHTRRLLRAGVAPDAVMWSVAAAAQPDLFAHDGAASAAAHRPAAVQTPLDGPHAGASIDTPGSGGGASPAVTMPRGFVGLCTAVVLFDDPQRWDLLYRIAWRLHRGELAWGDTLDADRVAAEAMARVVRREMHKMTAFVRFRPVGEGAGCGIDGAADGGCGAAEGGGERGGGGVRHVAWFEPAHHVVEATADFFCRRFANMRWAILTPRCCLVWEDGRLQVLPGVTRDRAPPADSGEDLWLTYYASIFNPARLKLDMMRKEMPRRYWPNLPESRLIAPLSAQAATRAGVMVEATPVPPRRRIRTAAPDVVPGVRVAASPGNAPPAATLDELSGRVACCTTCPFAEQATQAVAGRGDPHARLMLVGEQPGDQEDLQGRPFVGPAGQLLARALRQLGWRSRQLYVTNAVKHFKFQLRGKRRMHKTASEREVLACQDWLEQEIALVGPEAIVALGATAAFALLGEHVPIRDNHGRWMTRTDGRAVLIVLHPAALLRLPDGEQAAAFERWVGDLRQASPYAVPGDLSGDSR